MSTRASKQTNLALKPQRMKFTKLCLFTVFALALFAFTFAQRGARREEDILETDRKFRNWFGRGEDIRKEQIAKFNNGVGPRRQEVVDREGIRRRNGRVGRSEVIKEEDSQRF